MAVRVPAGAHSVRFDYMTPGLPAGVIIAAGSLLLFILYLIVVHTSRKRYPDRWLVAYPEGDLLAGRFAADQAEEEAYLAGLAEEEDPFGPDEQMSLMDFSATAAEKFQNPAEQAAPPPEPETGDLEGQTFIPGFKVDLSAADEEAGDDQ